MFRPKRTRDEKLLAEWSVDESTWREFIRAIQHYAEQPGGASLGVSFPKEFPPAGVTVAVREDALFVGRDAFDMRLWIGMQVTLREHWLEFLPEPDERPHAIFPVPVPSRMRADAALVAGHFTAVAAECSRIAAEQRARPTFSNRLLTLVERHFIVAVLLFFFVLLPVLVGVVAAFRSFFVSAP
ncbi:MAG: hypothetical protein H0W30_19105 [Gemmatimonadaceae bacterium]|nr:hypothetical protein [Gemmatimonadaceae bacterium]